MRLKTSVLAAVASFALAGAPGVASAFTLGPGAVPGLAVDAAGTAYIAWYSTIPHTLGFCRLARGAKQCDPGAAASITAPGGSGVRPFVVVSGDHVVVVQYRSGVGAAGFGALYAFSSTDRGVSFQAGRVIGKVAMTEAVAGPAGTISGVDDAGFNGMSFQNSPLDGSAPVDAEGNSTVGQAVLSSDHPYGGTVGLIDAVTPLSVFTTANGLGQFRRYGGSGSLNDAASWTPARDLGFVNQHTKLAGGPSGLFLLGSTSPGGDQLFVRKWNGTTFGPPAMLGTGGTPATQHLFQDAAGRLHAVFTVGDNSGLHLMHAVSDNGSAWRRGIVTTSSQPYAAYGNITDTRVATAPDHIGVVVWRAGNGPSEVRVAAVGPDAPAGKPPSQPAGQLAFKEGTYKLSGIPACLRNGQTVRVTLSFKRAKKSGNVVLGVRRTDFFLQGKRISKDTTAPFRVSIPVVGAKAGTTYVLRARAYLKVRRGPARTRSLSRSAKAC